MDECGRLAAELEGERGQVFRRRARDLASNPRRAGEKQVIERQPRKCLADLRTVLAQLAGSSRESASRFLTHGLGRLLVGQRRLVGASRAQRVVYIDDLQDSRKDRDFRANESVGIARTVGVLVVVADDGQHQAQRTQGLANILAGDGMEFHDGPLVRCEISVFSQNFIRHSDLSQIVEVAAASQSSDFFVIQPQMSA